MLNPKTCKDGNVVVINGDSVIISTQGAQHQYKIPKSHVEGYNDASIPRYNCSDMSSFNMDNDNNIEFQTHIRRTGRFLVQNLLPPVTITKTSSQTPMIQGQEITMLKKKKVRRDIRSFKAAIY